MKHCGRLDPHEPHNWTLARHGCSTAVYDEATYSCTGYVAIEGGAGCACCTLPIAVCRCYADLVEERRREWWT